MKGIIVLLLLFSSSLYGNWDLVDYTKGIELPGVTIQDGGDAGFVRFMGEFIYYDDAAPHLGRSSFRQAPYISIFKSNGLARLGFITELTYQSNLRTPISLDLALNEYPHFIVRAENLSANSVRNGRLFDIRHVGMVLMNRNDLWNISKVLIYGASDLDGILFDADIENVRDTIRVFEAFAEYLESLGIPITNDEVVTLYLQPDGTYNSQTTEYEGR